MKTLKITLASLLFICTAAVLPACNTAEGVGEDVSAAGEGVSDLSRDVRD